MATSTKSKTIKNGFDVSDYDNDDWGKPTENDGPFEHTCPSGKKCLVRRLEMTDILKLGLIEDMDFMAKALVEKPGDEGKDESTIIGSALAQGENFSKLESTVNLIVQAGVLAPKLQLPPRDENARQDGIRYVDKVSFTDRMDLFSVIFDSDGLTTFREEQGPGVADVPDVTDVPLPAE
jgi:hypothetical protein